MSQTLSPSVARCYGLARVARVWSISRASAYRALKETQPNTPPRRPGPVGACSDAELADHIRRQIAASRLHGEGYRKLWARLRFAGVRASPRRVRRVMRENGLLAPHRVGRTETKPHDGMIITDKVNEMWGTDMTQTITVREGRANVFVTVEHANSEVVGIHASRSAQLQPTGTLTPINVDARQDRNSRVCSAIKTAKSSLLQACGNHATQQLGQTGRGHSSEHEPPLPPQCVEPKQAHAIDLGRDRGQLSPGARLGRGGVRLNGSWLGSAIYPVDTAAVGLLREASLSPSFLRTTSAKNPRTSAGAC